MGTTEKEMKKGWKTLGRKKAEYILYIIRDVLSSSTMERADFSDELKEATRNWRWAWIIEPLQRVLHILEDLYQINLKSYKTVKIGGLYSEEDMTKARIEERQRTLEEVITFLKNTRKEIEHEQTKLTFEWLVFEISKLKDKGE